MLTTQHRIPRRINKRTGTTRERTGCLTCRQRKKRCNLGYPVCKECVRLNYTCKWEDPRPVHDDRSMHPVHQAYLVVDVPLTLWRVPDPVLFWAVEHADHESPSSRRHFLRYYTQSFTHLLTTNIENNSFLSVFLPIAMYNTPLLNALIAWSSSHLSLRDSSFHQVAMHNRCSALRDLRHSLEFDPSNVEVNLAITLVLCSLESIMADSNDAWYLHLVGAAGLISSYTPIEYINSEACSSHVLLPFTDLCSGKWLLRNFAYHDIMMAVALDRAPLLSSHYFLRLDDSPLADSYFGLASGILEILSQTATLNAELKTIMTCDETTVSHSSISTILTELQSLELRLTEWTCPVSPHVSLRLLAESYRSSTLIYLYRVISRALPPSKLAENSSKAASQVTNIVVHIEQMPKRSLPECTLLFPLFLAGGEATQEEHIQSIQCRMRDMIESRGFRNVHVALSVLEKLWRLRSVRKGVDDVTGCGREVDWIDIVQQEDISLSLS